MKRWESNLSKLDLLGRLGTTFSFFSQGYSRLDGRMRSSVSSPKVLFSIWVEGWRKSRLWERK